MKNVYLHEDHVAKLQRGCEPLFFNVDGERIRIARIEYLTREIQIKATKRLLAKLLKADEPIQQEGKKWRWVNRTCSVCGVKCKGKLGLAMHKHLKHEGGQSNLPRLMRVKVVA